MADDSSKWTKIDAAHALWDASAAELAAKRRQLQADAASAGLSLDDISRIINSRSELPRALLPEEGDTLIAILTHADFAGRDALLAQAASARASSLCGCGCATIGLEVDQTMSAAVGVKSPIPNEAVVQDADDEPLGGIIVFVDDGYLSSMEIYAWDEPISPFPPLDRLELRSKLPPPSRKRPAMRWPKHSR